MRYVVAAVMAIVTVMALASPAAATHTVACDRQHGWEPLTLDGIETTFAAPAATAPELAATVELTGQTVTDYRRALQYYQAFLAPAATAAVTVTLHWQGPSDYDLIATAADGKTYASEQSNLPTGKYVEQVTFEAAHCDDVQLDIFSWAGRPAEDLTIRIEMAPHGSLVCGAWDRDTVQCAGKEIGEPPAPYADERTFLYFSGVAGAPTDSRAVLTSQRPSTGIPQIATSGASEQNGAPAFDFGVTAPTTFRGEISTLLFLKASATKSDVSVELWADEDFVDALTVPADMLDSDEVTAVVVAFGDMWIDVTDHLTVRVRPEAGDVLMHYGSVQFPSRVTLPAAAPARN